MGAERRTVQAVDQAGAAGGSKRVRRLEEEPASRRAQMVEDQAVVGRSPDEVGAGRKVDRESDPEEDMANVKVAVPGYSRSHLVEAAEELPIDLGVVVLRWDVS